MSERTVLQARIGELKEELARVEGTTTEVYSRIVGYYRSVRNWNAGKREEYRMRRAFGMPSRAAPGEGGDIGKGMLVFTREACPNCSPVADYLIGAGLPAVFVDVDGEEGLALAKRHGVMSTPTVLGLDEEGRESFRAFGIKDLRARLEGIRVAGE